MATAAESVEAGENVEVLGSGGIPVNEEPVSKKTTVVKKKPKRRDSHHQRRRVVGRSLVLLRRPR
jgi:hypothetical protein